MLGCDYTGTIKSVGPKTAVDLIKKHRTIEEVILNLKEKQIIPKDWNYQEVRKLFTDPEVIDPAAIDLKWMPPKEKELREFLVDGMGFNEDRLQKGIEKLKKGAKTATQGRLDLFFKPATSSPSSPAKAKFGNSGGAKRKVS